MAQYYWYSHELAQKEAGQKRIDRDGKPSVDQGYGICMEVRSKEFRQFNHVSISEQPGITASDIELVMSIDYPHEIDIAVSRDGKLSKMAQNFCAVVARHPTVESVQAMTRNFKPVTPNSK